MAFSKVLVAFDGSELSTKALNTALAYCRENQAQLEVLHVVNFQNFVVGEAMVAFPVPLQKEIQDNAEKLMAKAEAQMEGLPGSRVVLRQGSPAAAILDHAEENQCDLIIIGSRGFGAFRSFMLGSVSNHVVQNSQIPVLVIK
ncbi:universal stress protein [Paenibacillus senegalensis]|uniref:universal stress protein n=1 Tax=Paenibacillus senegalensis TaxID=1465766 RepID=UPI0002894323|nr:universal stress protein [Paenibacillus senegalensis]